jgi:hypothetical protein
MPTLILMHNIDVMHQERNMDESIISTCMDGMEERKVVLIRASNEHLQTVEGQQMGSFCNASDTYLTDEQYVMVKYVGLNFISCLL